ncbi:hypothetical protein PCASD_17430 [Puccinia coronata f. sp. avenae]|uniref:Uncharacterized protein n=1 Tax=Puccinia coronata f. sp. avenae TaxID=200324 RepID=A0A2N5T5G1_9BASI|nr:hypothetical protein PCASD_17430 [Puccinia coronata f. sp. avenae]
MAQSREFTPPNLTTDTTLSTVTRQSNRICTPLARQGFTQPHGDSRRALLVPSSPTLPHQSGTSHKAPGKNRGAPKQPAKSKNASLISADKDECADDLAQDLDAKNAKAKAKPKKCKGGFDNPKIYYHPGEPAPDQSNGGLTYKCRWCPKSVRVNPSTNSNLKTRHDGSSTQNHVRKPCSGRGKAVANGAILPKSSTEEAKDKKKTNSKNPGTLTSFVQKGCFDNKTFNKLLVFWLIRHSLPWARFNNFFLGVAFDYCNMNLAVLSRSWAADYARKLYVDLQQRVITAIQVSI